MPIEGLERLLTENEFSGFLSLRYPWLQEARACHANLQPARLLFPSVVGNLDDVLVWLINREDCAVDPLNITDKEAAADISSRMLLEEFHSPNKLGGAAWCEDLLSACRERGFGNGGDPLRTFVRLAGESADRVLKELLDAQDRLGYCAMIPVVLDNRWVDATGYRQIFFGPPLIHGSLGTLPDVDAADQTWRQLYLALTSVWESGGIPRFAVDLYENLMKSVPAWKDKGFLGSLEKVLTDFGQKFVQDNPEDQEPGRRRLLDWVRPHKSLTGEECSGLTSEEDRVLWHMGYLTYQESRFDMTPLVARMLIQTSLEGDPDGREALRRRRLGNPILTRWMAAWAATVEELLRQVVLSEGESRFRSYLEKLKPINLKYRNRFEELRMIRPFKQVDGPFTAVMIADASDLVNFLVSLPPFRSWEKYLDHWKEARNGVVHRKRYDPDSVIGIGRLAQILRREGYF